VLGRHGNYVKVKLSESRSAFMEVAAVTEGGTAADEVAFTTLYDHAPPTLTVAAAALTSTTDTIKVDVAAEDDVKLLDMYMYVGSRKLFYQSNRDGADPRKASFSYDVPLQPGVNVITVVARETPDTTTRRTVIVRRDGSDGSIMKTPKQQGEFLLEALGTK
jgi:carboxyl-terminal processing protease